MKKLIALMTCAAAATTSVNAQALVAGFDFSNIGPSNSVGDFTATTSTDVGAAGNFAKGLFTLYTENSAYASDTDPYTGIADFAGSGWWQAGDADFDGTTAGENGLHTVRGTINGQGATPGGVASAINTDFSVKALQFTGAVDGGWFSFGIGSDFTGLTVEFDARAGANFQQVQTWYYITDAFSGDIASGDFSNAVLSGTYTPGASYADFSINLGDVDAGYLVFETSTSNNDPFTVGGIDGLFFDNVTFQGTVASAIPEPSAFGAIFGTLALAGALSRRRGLRQQA